MDVLSHLHFRHCFPERYNFVSWDDVEGTACFPLWNLSGKMVGYQQYRPDGDKKAYNHPKLGRYYTYCKDNIGVWALETLDTRSDVIFVVEGIFDAVKLHLLNLPAVAVLANDPKHIRPWLNSLGRATVAVCDNDAAGRKLAKSCQYALYVKDDKDLGAMTLSEAREFVKFNNTLIWNPL